MCDNQWNKCSERDIPKRFFRARELKLFSTFKTETHHSRRINLVIIFMVVGDIELMNLFSDLKHSFSFSSACCRWKFHPLFESPCVKFTVSSLSLCREGWLKYLGVKHQARQRWPFM